MQIQLSFNLLAQEIIINSAHRLACILVCTPNEDLRFETPTSYDLLHNSVSTGPGQLKIERIGKTRTKIAKDFQKIIFYKL